MASTPLTSEQVRNDVERARALLAETEEEFHSGTVDYEKLAAVRQELAFRQGLLEATVAREARKAREAEAEARRKIIEQKRRLKAEADLPVLEKKLMFTENLRAALLGLNDAFPGIHDDPVKYALAVLVDAYLPEVHGGPGRGALDKVRQEVLSGTDRGQIEALRKEIAEAKATLAASNGSHTTKGKS